MGTRLAGCRSLAVVWTLAIQLVVAGAASAAPPEFILQMPEGQTTPGSGAAELDNPRGMVGDPDTGHVYVADLNNARISVYTAWGLFVEAWGWGVEDGSPGLQTCGPAEPQGEPDPSLCQAGVAGAGEGQLNDPLGVALDPAGDLYAFDRGNLRVQKFNAEGEFLLMFGGDVNQTKVGEGAPAAQRNVCPVGPGDVCKAGVAGEEPSQFSGTIGNYVAYTPAGGGGIVVGDKDGIQVFELDGTHRETIGFEGELVAFDGLSVDALDVDDAGIIYFSLSGLSNVYKLSPAGVPLDPGKPGGSSFDVGDPVGVAVDTDGSVYAIDNPMFGQDRVRKFEADGNQLVPTADEEEADSLFPYIPFQGPALNGIATNFCTGSEEPGNLYLSYFQFGNVAHVNAYGTAPIGCEPPPLNPPEVTAQFATSVGREEATVKAQINPRFWPDATYYVEYGTGECAAGGCPAKAPLAPQLLTGKSVSTTLTTAGVVLEGLQPGVTYHYRFVAQSSGGGPVFGIDPDGREGPAEASPSEGLDATFTTFSAPTPAPPCANDAVRLGPSKRLPDCRAYEMVSPLDKAGGDVALWRGRNAIFPEFFEMHISAPSGSRFTYSSSFAFGDAKGAPFVSQYLAERGSAGWGSEAISATPTQPLGDLALGNEFRGFSEDLCQGWVRLGSVASLAPGAIEKYHNLYRRQNCIEPPSYEALSTQGPLNRTSSEYVITGMRGFSEDGTHTTFTANGRLTTDAPDLGTSDFLLYEATGGQVRFVCYLPSGKAINGACTAGAMGGTGGVSQLHNAVSADGSRIFWTAYQGPLGNDGIPGQVFARVDGAETRKVSTTKAPDPAWYWTASDDGTKAIFAFEEGPLKDQLYEVDVDTETPRLIAQEVDGPMGASEDASRIYFSAREDLDGGGPATKGEHNLYLYEADPLGGPGEFSFIMELPVGDTVGSIDIRTPINVIQPRSARVSPDGLHTVFTSVASPTPSGYDNLDANSGEPTQQVYHYDAVSEKLSCVSCNPTGARPTGENTRTSFDPYYVAARIQGWELNSHAPRVVSDDGSRVFFESLEALVPGDSNGTWDVYQWEEAGKGTCGTGSATFSTASGGCVDLISSGESSAKSIFLDADPSGDNVFIGTHSSLVGADYGLSDVYDARVGGGFPEPTPRSSCEGDACQSPPPPPPEVTPSTETSQGPGNAVQPKRRRCPKGKRRIKRAGKARCVKRKAKAGSNRRVGR